MKEFPVSRLSEAFKRAEREGWESYSQRVWKRLRQINQPLYDLFTGYIELTDSERELPDSNTMMVRQSCAMIFECIDYLNRVSSSTIEAIGSEIFLTGKEEDELEELYDDGDLDELQFTGEESDWQPHGSSKDTYSPPGNSSGSGDKFDEEDIDDLSVRETEDAFFQALDNRRKKVYLEGRRCLLLYHREFYATMRKYVNFRAERDEALKRFMLEAVDLIFAILVRHQSNRKIDRQFRRILKS
jgi:hypothetical protein